MHFGRSTTEECFLVSVYKEAPDVSCSICDVKFDHLVKEVSARFFPWKIIIFKVVN